MAITYPPLWEDWKHIAASGSVIKCRSMRLLAGDFEPEIVVGEGSVRADGAGGWQYSLKGVPLDLGYAMKALSRLAETPYDGTLRSRLEVVDDHGRSISFGRTISDMRPSGDGQSWMFSGECDYVTVTGEGATVPETTDLFLLPQNHHTRDLLRRIIGGEDMAGVFQQRLELDGGDLVFRLYDAANMLTISATATDLLPLTYTENWLAEPLQILFGQHVYPRIVARSQKSNSQISCRPSPRWSKASDVAGLIHHSGNGHQEGDFWATYIALLRFVAQSRGSDGQPNFEANDITRYYLEVVSAARSSRWLYAMAFASAVEGVINKICPPGKTEPSERDMLVKAFKDHVDLWEQDCQIIKQAAKQAASRTVQTSAAKTLKALLDSDAVTSAQHDAWHSLRHHVMHGKLISPYSSEQEDKLLLDLAGLLHAVTKVWVRKEGPHKG